MTSDKTSLTLLERAVGQDQRAWNRLVELYAPLVYAWCRAAGLQPADAADVAQDVFTAVAQHLLHFVADPTKASFRPWLRTIARNKITDQHRRKLTEPLGRGGSCALDLLSSPEDPSGSSDQDPENMLLLSRAMDLLETDFEPVTRQAFTLVVIEGGSPDEVAGQLSITRNAVYLAKRRVLQRLREEFAGLIDLPSIGEAEAGHE
jgi:RNA polymerase sigma-70 factor (ECF subfamily)